MATNAHIVDGHASGADLAILLRIAGSPLGATSATGGASATAIDDHATGTANDLILVELRPAEWPDRTFAWPESPVSGRVAQSATDSNTDVRDEDATER